MTTVTLGMIMIKKKTSWRCYKCLPGATPLWVVTSPCGHPKETFPPPPGRERRQIGGAECEEGSLVSER